MPPRVTTSRQGDWLTLGSGTEPRVRMVDMPSMAQQWSTLGDDLTQYTVAAAPMGGYIAVAKLPPSDLDGDAADVSSKAGGAPADAAASSGDGALPMHQAFPATSEILVFQADGGYRHTITVEGQVLFMTFNELNDELLVLTHAGQLYFYTYAGDAAVIIEQGSQGSFYTYDASSALGDDSLAGTKPCLTIPNPSVCASTQAGIAVVTNDNDIWIVHCDTVRSMRLKTAGGSPGGGIWNSSPTSPGGGGGARGDATSSDGGAASIILAKYDVFVMSNNGSIGPDLPTSILAIPLQLLGVGDGVRLVYAPLEMDADTPTSPIIFQTAKRANQRYSLEPDRSLNPSACDKGSFIRMALSPDGKKIGIVSASGLIHVTTPDFTSYHKVADTQTLEPPKQFVWCGNDALAFLFLSSQFPGTEYQTTLSVFSLHEYVVPGRSRAEAPLAYVEELQTIPDDSFLVVETDGFRIIAADGARHSFLQALPDYAVHTYQRATAGASPAAQLVRAFDIYEDGDPNSVKAVRSLLRARDSGPELLHSAVVECLQTAAFEFQPPQQQRLLRIAAYGKTFCTVFDTAEFTAACRRIRAWNALRRSCGMLCTMPQFIAMEHSGNLLKRLIVQRQYPLADQLAQWLGMPQRHAVLEAWARTQIDEALSAYNETERDAQLDAEVAKNVQEKTATCHGVQFTAIARYAHDKGRDNLFRLLLAFEPSAEKHVTELLRQKDYNTALTKAVDFIDSDLIYACLLQVNNLDAVNFQNVALLAGRRDRMAHDMWVVVQRHLKQALPLGAGGAASALGAGKAAGPRNDRRSWKIEFPVAAVQYEILQYFVNLEKVRSNANDALYRLTNDDPGKMLHDSVDELLKQARAAGTLTVMASFLPSPALPTPGASMKDLGGGQGAGSTAASSSTLLSLSKFSSTLSASGGTASGPLAEWADATRSLLAKQVALSTDQKKFAETLNGRDDAARRNNFIGATAVGTLELLWEYRFPEKVIDDFVKKMKFPDKTAGWCKLRGLMRGREYDKVVEMGRGRSKPTVDPAAVVFELIGANQAARAVEFIPKVADLSDRLEFYIQAGEWGRAATDMVKSKAPTGLDQLRDRARGQPEALAAIDAALGAAR